MLDAASLGVWIATLKTAIETGLKGAQAVRDLLKKAQDDETCLTPEQRGRLTHLKGDASAADIIRAVQETPSHAGDVINQNFISGGEGGDARALGGSATGGAGGSVSAHVVVSAEQVNRGK